jgi:hypothetical protein
MPRQVRVDGVVHSFPDDATDAEISAALNSGSGQKPMATREAHMTAGPDTIDSLASTLPYLGGMAGGILGGGWASVPLAAIGGAGGRGLEKTISTLRHGIKPTDPTSAMGDMKDMALAGAEQGAYELGGKAVAPITHRLITKPLMNMAISAPRIVKEFPGVVGHAADERIPVGKLPGIPRWVPGNRGLPGSERAELGRIASSTAEEGTVKAAEAAGLSTPPTDLLRTSTKTANRMIDAPLADRAVGNIGDLHQEFLDTHQSPITPTRLRNMKQIGQSEGESVLRAEHAGGHVPSVDAATGQFNRDVAKDARASLAGYPAPYGPQLDRQMQQTQKMVGIQRAMEETEGKRFSLNPMEARNMAAFAGGSAMGSRVRIVRRSQVDDCGHYRGPNAVLASCPFPYRSRGLQSSRYRQHRSCTGRWLPSCNPRRSVVK